METEFDGKLHHRNYGPVVSDLKEMGRKSTEWDLNDWSWDGDRFVAVPVNSAPSDRLSRQFLPVDSSNVVGSHGASDEVPLGNEREKRDLEKRRRDLEGYHVVEVNEEAESLNLKLGAQVYPIAERELENMEGKNGKKNKISGAPLTGAVCQVEDCNADLSNAKDYHRRHKVCGFHSKASSALVGNAMQRFCQQCSRFHVLEEFDEGKRSCRRRLSGHNKRRRKTHPENAPNSAPLNDENGIQQHLLVSLIRMLSDIHSRNSDQTKEEGLVSHMLRNLANHAGGANDRNIVGVSQDIQKEPARHSDPSLTMLASDVAHKQMAKDNDHGGIAHNASASQSATQSHSRANDQVNGNDSDSVARTKTLNVIDLNFVCKDDTEDLRDKDSAKNANNASPVLQSGLRRDSEQSSPPQNSGNSGTMWSQSRSTSNGEIQSRTDRIVFKIFGKDPSDCPLVLRKEILDWLSNIPTDIESYIRPGCIILTIYLRMDESTWEELYCDLTSSLSRLLALSTGPFWRTGWIYTRIQHHAAFMYNGRVVLDAPLTVKSQINFKISSIRPIAVTMSEEIQFVVRGSSLFLTTSRLLCSLDGEYLLEENCADIMVETDSSLGHDAVQSLSFHCVIPNIMGRGFIEVEDYGLSSSFFPFIVAEKDVCSEIRSLESVIEACEDGKEDDNDLEMRNQALDYVHEFGWLLHRSRLRSRLGKNKDETSLFPFKRFKWLIEFSVDHDWRFVVEKLLNILFDGTVDLGQENNLRELLDIGLLHRAVKRNCRSMVEFLLRYDYHPSGALDKGSTQKQYLFRPDATGPGGLTPLHIAARMDNSENILDALTDDPRSVGIIAWKNVRDCAGLTPHDYACFHGHYSYIHLVRRKLDKRLGSGHIVIDVPGDNQKTAKYAAAFESSYCRECEQKSSYGNSLRVYRPAMLSMVAIAAVCVCTALLFKTMPVVVCSFGPFRWELLKYGYQ